MAKVHMIFGKSCPLMPLGVLCFVCQNGVKSVRTAWPIWTEFLPKLRQKDNTCGLGRETWIVSPALSEQKLLSTA